MTVAEFITTDFDGDMINGKPIKECVFLCGVRPGATTYVKYDGHHYRTSRVVKVHEVDIDTNGKVLMTVETNNTVYVGFVEKESQYQMFHNIEAQYVRYGEENK